MTWEIFSTNQIFKRLNNSAEHRFFLFQYHHKLQNPWYIYFFHTWNRWDHKEPSYSDTD